MEIIMENERQKALLNKNTPAGKQRIKTPNEVEKGRNASTNGQLQLILKIIVINLSHTNFAKKTWKTTKK